MTVGFINTTDDEEIKALWRKIRAARRWAIEHFNAGAAGNNRIVDEVDGRIVLSRPAFFVEFPKPNLMLVCPSIMGQRTDITIKYTITFRKNGSVAWYGLHPVTEKLLPPLVLSKDEIDRFSDSE